MNRTPSDHTYQWDLSVDPRPEAMAGCGRNIDDRCPKRNNIYRVHKTARWNSERHCLQDYTGTDNKVLRKDGRLGSNDIKHLGEWHVAIVDREMEASLHNLNRR